MRVTVLVGLIGAGKTTLANHLGNRVGFDLVWHGCFQKTGTKPEDFAKNIFLEDGMVFDGWWTWSKKWWERRRDTTLKILGERADVRLIYLKMTPEQALAEYKKKPNVGPIEKYRVTIEDRIEYMERLVRQWGT